MARGGVEVPGAAAARHRDHPHHRSVVTAVNTGPGAKMGGGVTASRQQSTLLHTDIFNLVLNTDQLNNWK